MKETNHRFGAAYCGFLGWNSPKNDLDRYKTRLIYLFELLLLDYRKHYLHTNTATYKNSAVFALNGFDESYRRHQDLEFNLRFFDLYETLVTKSAGVRLNPAPSDISNKVFGIKMLQLKQKFLEQFKFVIEESGRASEIYEKHWEEVVRYVQNQDDLIDEILDDNSVAYAQVLNKMIQAKAKVQDD